MSINTKSIFARAYTRDALTRACAKPILLATLLATPIAKMLATLLAPLLATFSPHVLPPLLQNRLQNVNLLAAPLSTLLAKRQTYCFQGIFLHDVADSFHDYGRIVRYGYM